MKKFNSLMDDSLLNIDSLNDIPEGSLFGIVTDTSDMDIIYPDMDAFEGDFSMQMETESDKFMDSDDDKVNEAKKSVSDEMLLMVKKLKGNLVQEVLSGEIFAIRGTNKDENDFSKENIDLNDLNRFVSIEKFQNSVSKYSNACIRIESRMISYDPETKDQFGVFFAITDEFKKLYSEETLPQRDKIVELLKACKRYAKDIFKDKYKKSIDNAQSIATTENFIYDLENSDKSKTM